MFFQDPPPIVNDGPGWYRVKSPSGWTKAEYRSDMPGGFYITPSTHISANYFSDIGEKIAETADLCHESCEA